MQLRSRGTKELIDLADGMTVGRMSDCTLQLQDGSISRHHATIEAVSGAFYLVDNGSSNGCFRNGERIKRCVIRPGDLLTLGALAFDVVGPALSEVSDPAIKPSSAAAPSATFATPAQDAASASSRAGEAAAERARLRHEITGTHRSRGLGDLGQQPFGVKVLVGMLGLAMMYGVITGIRYLAGSL